MTKGSLHALSCTRFYCYNPRGTAGQFLIPPTTQVHADPLRLVYWHYFLVCEHLLNPMEFRDFCLSACLFVLEKSLCSVSVLTSVYFRQSAIRGSAVLCEISVWGPLSLDLMSTDLHTEAAEGSVCSVSHQQQNTHSHLLTPTTLRLIHLCHLYVLCIFCFVAVK